MYTLFQDNYHYWTCYCELCCRNILSHFCRDSFYCDIESVNGKVERIRKNKNRKERIINYVAFCKFCFYGIFENEIVKLYERVFKNST